MSRNIDTPNDKICMHATSSSTDDGCDVNEYFSLSRDCDNYPIAMSESEAEADKDDDDAAPPDADAVPVILLAELGAATLQTTVR